MMNYESSVKSLIREIEEHPCGIDQIVRKDTTRKLRFGFECLSCGKKWEIRLTYLKAAGEDICNRLFGIRVLKSDPFSSGVE